MCSADSAPYGYISSTCYKHAGAHWDLACVKQSMAVMCLSVFKNTCTCCTLSSNLSMSEYRWAAKASVK